MWLTCTYWVPNSLTFLNWGDCHFLKLQVNSYSAQSTFDSQQQLQKVAINCLALYSSHVQLDTKPSTFPLKSWASLGTKLCPLSWWCTHGPFYELIIVVAVAISIAIPSVSYFHCNNIYILHYCFSCTTKCAEYGYTTWSTTCPATSSGSCRAAKTTSSWGLHPRMWGISGKED